MTRSRLDFFVLDSLSVDVESFEQALEMLNTPEFLGWLEEHGQPFTRGEVLAALLHGIQTGDIEACVAAGDGRPAEGLGPHRVPPGPPDEAWFRLTDRGRGALEAWDPWDTDSPQGPVA